MMEKLDAPEVIVAYGAGTIMDFGRYPAYKLGIPFGENIMKSIGSGVATNLASYLAMTGVASAIKFIPGIGSLGGAILMSASLYAVTLAAGWIYLQALCTLAEKKGNTFNASDITQAVNDILRQKSVIKDFINEAKKAYKK